MDQEPFRTAGVLNLNGVEYDSCPLYQVGHYTALGATVAGNPRVFS